MRIISARLLPVTAKQDVDMSSEISENAGSWDGNPMSKEHMHITSYPVRRGENRSHTQSAFSGGFAHAFPPDGAFFYTEVV